MWKHLSHAGIISPGSPHPCRTAAEAAASPWKPPGTVHSLEWDCRFPLLLLFFSVLAFYNGALSDAVSATALTGRLNAAATTATLGDELNAASQRDGALRKRDGVPGEMKIQCWRER